jgi:NADH-quinone oxidoreductase subunit E
VNYRYFHKISHDEADRLLDDLKAGRRAHEVPKHGTLGRVRQQIPAERRAGAAVPGECTTPVWLSPAGSEPEGAGA